MWVSPDSAAISLSVRAASFATAWASCSIRRGYYQKDDLLERDLLRPRLLRNFDWNIMLVLTKDWFDNSDAVMQFVEQKIAGNAPKPTYEPT